MIKLLSRLIYSLIRLFDFTYRYRYIHQEKLDKAKRAHPNGAYLFAIWHQNAILGMLNQRGIPHSIIISQSKDGEFVAYAAEKMGFTPVRGSSTRGGVAAKDMMKDLLHKGLPGAITVDGPKGPAKTIKRGIIDLARETGAQIVPIAPIPKNHWTFTKSWDQFRLPKPFTKVIVCYGNPIAIPADTSNEQMKEFQEKIAMELELAEAEARKFF